MQEISQVKVSLEFAFTDGEQHSETDMQMTFLRKCPTITSYILAADDKLAICFKFPIRSRIHKYVITESNYSRSDSMHEREGRNLK